MPDDPTTQDPAPAEPAPQPQHNDPVTGGTPEPDWKAQARKWEERAKVNSAAAKKLAELEASQQTEQQKAEARAAAAEARAAAAVESIAAARLEAALTGLVADPGAVVADLNVRKFLGEDGEPDAEKIAALKARYAAMAPQGPRAPAVNPAQGNGLPVKTLAEQIADAEGRRDETRGRRETAESMRLKSRQLLASQRQGPQ